MKAEMMLSEAERNLILRIRTQQILGKGLFLEDEEFIQWAMNEYDLSRDRLAQLAKESI